MNMINSILIVGYYNLILNRQFDDGQSLNRASYDPASSSQITKHTFSYNYFIKVNPNRYLEF